METMNQTNDQSNIVELKPMVDAMSAKFEEFLTQYSSEWHDLDQYRGMAFVDKDGNEINKAEYEEVNIILNNLQALFHEMYPVLHYVNSRATMAKNLVDQYGTLMEKLIEGGAEVFKVDETTVN